MCISVLLSKYKNWNSLGCLDSGVRPDAVRVLAPRIYEGGATSSLSWWRGECEFPKQSVKQHYLFVFTVLFPRSFL